MSNTTTADSTCTSGAIQVAADYTNNSKTDWHLPSKDELAQLYAQRTKDGGFSTGYYWSSSDSGDTAWAPRFGTGNQDSNWAKGNSFYVRLVRAFGSETSCANGGPCALGETGPGGGIVFYVHPSGTFACGATLASTCKYLEAAPTTGTNNWFDRGYPWSGNTQDAIGANARGTLIGTGYKNTEAMVTQSSTAGRAGTITRAYRGPNNLSDWYLPSKDELEKLYAQRNIVGGLNGSSYFSSSEFNEFYAWYQNFLTGYQGQSGGKSASVHVRPVRAFG